MTDEPKAGPGLIDAEVLARRCLDDGEFMMAARYWNGGLRLTDGERHCEIRLVDGRPEPGPTDHDDALITITAESGLWAEMTRAVPPPFLHDITAALDPALNRRAIRTGPELAWWQYAPAVQRAVELLADPRPSGTPSPTDSGPLPRTDSPVGRYIHLDLDGADHRIYYEEAGVGIPMLLQHTAGSQATQWRHLFENPAITDRFRLIAYDLPYHGKSVPPVDREWWTREYKLTGEFLRSVPLQLAAALGLDRPVFMGCSVGGLLALDLAARHPQRFRHVISLEGALHIGGDPDRLTGFWHPQVGNETKARMMQALTSPTSPDAYRKETIQTYASGWPQSFIGDLHYYMVDYDLRDRAGQIDTSVVGVDILSGQYDTSGTVAHGRAAHEAIEGSHFAEMTGVGHFPMSENPEAFFRHLLPVLDRIIDSHRAGSQTGETHAAGSQTGDSQAANI